MKYNPAKHQRRSLRLKGYDYSQDGAYFITLCTHQRQCLFGQVVEGEMQLNEIGLWIQSRWQKLPQNFPALTLDTWVIMPNHLHGILWLGTMPNNPLRSEAFGNLLSRYPQNFCPNASPSKIPRSVLPSQRESPEDSPANIACSHPRGTQPSAIAAIVQNFKSISTRKINQLHNSTGRTIWQRNYYEHIIRNADTLQCIRDYISNNPLTWELDQLHPHTESE